MKVAIVQHDIVWAQPAENLRRLSQLLDQDSGADLYVLAETFATGFLAKETQSLQMIQNSQNNQDFQSPLSWLQSQAQKRDAAFAASVATVDEEGTLRNRLFCVRPDGNYDYYDKTSWICDTARAVAAKEERLVRYKFTCYLTLKRPGYDLRRQSMHTEADIRNGIKRYEAALAEILKQIPAEASRREQVLCLNDWLTSHNSYTTRRATPPPSMAYSPLSALEGKSGDDGLVCEAYSRGLKVLCDRLGIPCIVVSGRARDKADRPYEDHLWNCVRMEDGQWYAVDVTWNDPVNTGDEEAAGRACSGFESHKWMLLGSLSDVADGFSFDSSHTEDPSGGYAPAGTLQWNLLPGPALAEQGYADPAASPQ